MQARILSPKVMHGSPPCSIVFKTMRIAPGFPKIEEGGSLTAQPDGSPTAFVEIGVNKLSRTALAR
jgi:hypothetical protein